MSRITDGGSPFDTELRGILDPTLSMDEYHQLPALGRSGCRLLLEPGGPALYQHRQRHPKTSSAMELGSAIHLAVLEPERFDLRARPWNVENASGIAAQHDLPPPKGKTVVRSGGLWALASALPEVLWLTDAEYAKAKRIAEWVRSRKGVRRLFPPTGLAEATLLWPDGGVDCKSRIDWVTPDKGRFIDLKTTAHPLHDHAKLSRNMKDQGTHIQAAMALRGALEQDTIEPPTEFWILFVSTDDSRPPDAELLRMPPEAITEGEADFIRARDIFQRCTETGDWPSRAMTIENPKREAVLPWQSELL